MGGVELHAQVIFAIFQYYSTAYLNIDLCLYRITWEGVQS